MASLLTWGLSGKFAGAICNNIPSEREMGGCVQWHISFPSIIYWTLFNEGWGQFDTVDTIRWASKLDPSRLWDAASGWVDPADPTSSPSTSNHGNATGYVRLFLLQRHNAANTDVKHCFKHPDKQSAVVQQSKPTANPECRCTA